MNGSYTRLEGAILTVMKAHLEVILLRGGFETPEAKKYDALLRSQIHPLINTTVPCAPEELTVTTEMLAREGLLEMRFNDLNRKEEGYVITKEGLIAVRNLF